MHTRLTAIASTALCLLMVRAHEADEGEKLPVTRYAAIWNTRGRCLERAGEKSVEFRKVVSPETVWNITFLKEGVTITMEKSGKLLCIDPDTEKLSLCGESGPNIVWQVHSATATPIQGGRSFKAIVSMKLGDKDLRLSSDESGVPQLGGKAEIMHFRREGP